MDIGERIILLREKNGWSQAEFARRTKINKSVMNRIESGERAIRDQELLTFAKVFGVSTDYLLGLSSEKDLQSEEEEFKKWAKDSSTGAFFSEILESEEAEIEELREIWEIMKKRRKK